MGRGKVLWFGYSALVNGNWAFVLGNSPLHYSIIALSLGKEDQWLVSSTRLNDVTECVAQSSGIEDIRCEEPRRHVLRSPSSVWL
ncbi:hypothetical protein RRG08_026169 [Elysia crispata]|uniref:Uncharacterized protein n=1 Tax=Elysia crispata TaxID=231223 RepID=A0AAE0ZAE1_9GAST|nr:hypothetical protein RRG08_026169 [Elysia crispata]